MRFALFALALVACGGTEDLEIAGSYVDDFGGMHDITNESWTQMYDGGDTGMDSTSMFAITQYDNEMSYLVAQNDSANAFEPDKWSRFDWTGSGSDVYYCQTAYDADTEEDAAATPAADSDDLLTGCNNFPWTKMTAE